VSGHGFSRAVNAPNCFFENQSARRSRAQTPACPNFHFLSNSSEDACGEILALKLVSNKWKVTLQEPDCAFTVGVILENGISTINECFVVKPESFDRVFDGIYQLLS
jgi:hypothetical protein